MTPTASRPQRSRRLSLAVVTAGSLVLGGAIGGGALVVPAFAAPAVVGVAETAADVPPIVNRRPVVPVPAGQETFTIDEAKSDPANGVLVLDFPTGLLEDGEPIYVDSSMAPESGWTSEATVKDGQIWIEPTENGGWYAPSDYRHVTVSVARGTPQNAEYLGGLIYAPEGAITLPTDLRDEYSGRPLLKVGTSSWVFDLPQGYLDVVNSSVTIHYYSENPDSNVGYTEIEPSDVSVADGKLTISDPRLAQLTEGTGYWLNIIDPGNEDRGSAYVGLYNEQVEPSPTPEPSPEPTPTPEPSPEPTPTLEPTPTPEPSPEPTPTLEPTPTPEPSPEPTPTPDPTPTPEPTPTLEPTPTPEPTPSSEPTDVPEAQEPEAGEPVAPSEKKLSYDAESSDPRNGTYVYDVDANVNDGNTEVTYRTSPDAEPRVVEAVVVDGKLTIVGDDEFVSAVRDHHEVLITLEEADGRKVSAVVSGADSLALISDTVDDRLGVPLAQIGAEKWAFEVPENFPELADGAYRFDVKYIGAEGGYQTLEGVSYVLDGDRLVIDDVRVPAVSVGTYYLYGEPAGSASSSAAEAAIEGSVSTWFGVYAPAAAPTDEPSEEPTTQPSEDQTHEPSEQPTTDPTQDPSVSPEGTQSPEKPRETQSAKPKDELAETGVSAGLLAGGAIALGLIVAGALAMGLRRGKHS
ncbi:PT domain-containing protein [Glutamicibacter endophyticus]